MGEEDGRTTAEGGGQENAIVGICLGPESHITYRGRTFPPGDLDTFEGAPILLLAVEYRGKKPVTVDIVISRKGDSVWYLGNSFNDAEQTVAWYKKRFWVAQRELSPDD